MKLLSRFSVVNIIFSFMCVVLMSGTIFAIESPYSYLYEQELIQLYPSGRLVAVRDENGISKILESRADFSRHTIADDIILQEKGYVVFKDVSSVGVKRENTKIDMLGDWADLLMKVEKFHVEVQPVFEQGGAILIPFEEIIIGFESETNTKDAQIFLHKNRDNLGLIDIRPHSPNTYIIRIADASNGRCYPVSRILATYPNVAFAEPNHIVIMSEPEKPVLGNRMLSMPHSDFIYSNDNLRLFPIYEESIVQESPQATGDPGLSELDKAMTSWTTLAFVDFDTVPLPATWVVSTVKTTLYNQPAKLASWGTTTYRRKSGTKSLYCAASGSQGVSAPGPAPINMGAVLLTSTYNLTPYEEVYIDFWYWIENDLGWNNGPTLYDFPEVLVYSQSTGQYQRLGIVLDFYMQWEGSQAWFAKDPTTQGGWAHCLYRVPDTFRLSDAFFCIFYHSDTEIRREGAYIDDIRIVGTTNVDAEYVSNDSYGARHWDKRNTGQIAGYGNDSNDLRTTPSEAWNLVNVSPEIVIAVIDTGVELTHPDLNLVPGFDYNGVPGGAPRGNPRIAHGTACAGEAGAIGNNGIGVIGQAPGCKIMPVYAGATQADIASAISVAASKNVNILSMSLGWVSAPVTAITNAINLALAGNQTVVIAAGNGPDRYPFTYDVGFPGNLTESTNIICVGASSPTDQHKSASSSDGIVGWGSSYVGAGPDVCAPGPWSYTTDLLGSEGYNSGSPNVHADYTHSFGGTSASAPKVAGIVALMLSKNPTLTPAQVKTILKNTADPMTATGNVQDMTGSGRVNAYNAIQAVPSVVTTGSLSVTLQPAGAVSAGAQWRVDGGAWQNSGAVVSGLSAGSHTISFKSVTGWTTPANQTISIVAGQTTNITGTYTQVPTTGFLSVTLQPAGAVSAGAQWCVNGGAWQNSGAVVSGLSAGSHTVSYKSVTGWTAPSNQTISIVAGQTTNLTGTYTQGSSGDWQTIFSDDFEGVFPGANWTLYGDPSWGSTTYSTHSGAKSVYCAGSSVAAPGPYPHGMNAWMVYGPFSLADAELAEYEFWFRNLSEEGYDRFGCYASLNGNDFYGGYWTGNQNTWRSYTFDLNDVFTLGSLCGQDQVWIGLHFYSDGSINDLGTFVDDIVIRKRTSLMSSGAVCVVIQPEDAVGAGAQWCVDGNEWQNCSAVVSDLSAGQHSISFKSIPGWTAPTAQTVHVEAGQTTYLTGTYELAAGLEADVAPRPENDGLLLVNDWVQVGRFVAGLDAIESSSEFQRADCAPQETSGDGQLLVNDWVQAGRYVSGLDEPDLQGGPTSPVKIKTTN